MLTKICTACNTEKSLNHYTKEKNGKYGVRSLCILCRAQEYQDNKIAIREQHRAYYKNNKEAVIKQTNKYRKNNPHLHRALTVKRKAAKLKAIPLWADSKAIKGIYQLAFLFKQTGINMHVDHIVPLQSDLVCGLHCESNLQLLPASDNISKGNRYWPDMW